MANRTTEASSRSRIAPTVLRWCMSQPAPPNRGSRYRSRRHSLRATLAPNAHLAGFCTLENRCDVGVLPRFLKDTERTPRVCDDVLASNDIKVVGLPDTDVYARCVTADDAEAYASWLTARTRKRYRLPTAVEWEYAMRTIGAPVLSSGIVAEIVADCWQDLLPRSGREIIASQSGAFDWLKGASTSDDAKWHRPSARRMLPHRAALIAVGFRVCAKSSFPLAAQG